MNRLTCSSFDDAFPGEGVRCPSTSLRRTLSESAASEAHIGVPLCDRLTEQARDVWRFPFIASWMRDVRYGLRTLRRSPGFTTAAVLTLTLGIGGTTAIFILIDAVMLRSLPVSDPARLYRIGDGDDSTAIGRHGRWGMVSFPLYERLETGTPEFEDITAFDWGGSLLSVRRQGADSAARPLRSAYVTGTYFSTFGVGGFAGRVFAADDDPVALTLAAGSLVGCAFSSAIIPAGRAAAISPTLALRAE
jgi:hypothetical protein